jgi:hypothetical protein
MVVPLVRDLPLGLRQRLLGLQRVVDDDDVGAAPGQDAADRGGEPATLRRRVEFGYRGALRREAGREDPAVPIAGDDAAAIARQFVGEVLRIAEAEDLRRGIRAETPRREGDRGEQRLQVAGRQVDDEAPDLAAAQSRQFGGDDFDMPAHREAGARVELGETALCEADEVAPRNSARYSSGVGISPDEGFTTVKGGEGLIPPCLGGGFLPIPRAAAAPGGFRPPPRRRG